MSFFQSNQPPAPQGCGTRHPWGAGGWVFKGLSCKLGGREVLKNITGEILPGKVTAVLGPNGCGKSTFLRALLGLVQVQAGVVLPNPKKMGYLPQKKEIYWPLTCEVIADLGSRASGLGSRALTRLGIGYLRYKRIDEVSGGERTLVLLARALRDEPDLIIADEPVSELDPKYQVEVMRILKEEAARGAIVLVTMHDIQLTQKFCDEVFLMRDGQIIKNGSTEQTITPENLEASFKISFTQEKGLYAQN